jgi:hypothetical protein
MTVFWRRELLDEVGDLDPAFPLAFDYDYWLRLANVCPPVCVDRKLAAFRWHATSKSGANWRAQIAEEERIAQKHGGTSLRHRLSKGLQSRLRRGVYRGLDLLSS